MNDQTHSFARGWDVFEAEWAKKQRGTPVPKGVRWVKAVGPRVCRTNQSGFCQCRCKFTVAAIDQSERAPVAITRTPVNHQRALTQASSLQPFDDRLIVIVPVVT